MHDFIEGYRKGIPTAFGVAVGVTLSMSIFNSYTFLESLLIYLVSLLASSITCGIVNMILK